MRSTSELTERLRLNWPIIQAPMGIMSTPALAAAVSNAGGLGGMCGLPPRKLASASAAFCRNRVEASTSIIRSGRSQ